MPLQSKYGDVLYHKLTEEPVAVLRSWKHVTFVRRPIQGTNGLSYKFGFFLNTELETLQEQTARVLSNIQARNAIAEAGMTSDLIPAPETFKKSN